MSSTGISELMEVVLYVQDMNLQVSFYRDIIGLPVKEPDGVKNYQDFIWVELDTGSCTLVLHGGGKQQQGEHAPKIVFRVANINKSRYELLEKGVAMGEVHSPASDVWVCDGTDPEGNKFSIEAREDIPFTPPVKKIPTNLAPKYVSVNSRRGRSITLLRNSKLATGGELVALLACFYVLQALPISSIFPIYLLMMVLLWLRGNGLSDLGFVKPARLRPTIIVGFIAAAFNYLLNILVIAPIAIHIAGKAPNLSVFHSIQGNTLLFIGYLIYTWTSAAFAEEVIFRGYVMNRLADLFGHTGWGWTLALFGQAICFGFAHLYQGIAGMIITGFGGFFLGLLYLATARNLWLPMITHGLIDTLSFLLTFLGL